MTLASSATLMSGLASVHERRGIRPIGRTIFALVPPGAKSRSQAVDLPDYPGLSAQPLAGAFRERVSTIRAVPRLMEMMMKRRVWHIDALFGLLMAAIIGAAYFFDGTADPKNAIKPVITKADKRLLCADGQSPVDWICPNGVRL